MRLHQVFNNVWTPHCFGDVKLVLHILLAESSFSRQIRLHLYLALVFVPVERQ